MYVSRGTKQTNYLTIKMLSIMSTKNVYCVVKTIYRSNSLVFRYTVCIETSFKKAYCSLVNYLKTELLVKDAKLRFLASSAMVTVWEHNPDNEEIWEVDKFYQIFKMELGEVGSLHIEFSEELIEKMKGEIYGC